MEGCDLESGLWGGGGTSLTREMPMSGLKVTSMGVGFQKMNLFPRRGGRESEPS